MKKLIVSFLLMLVMATGAWSAPSMSGGGGQPADDDLTIYAGITPSANMQTFLGSADFAAMRTNLSLVPGTNVQAYDADLALLAAMTVDATANTVGITNGTASINVAAGIAADINAAFTVNTALTIQTGAVTITGNAAGSTLVLPSGSIEFDAPGAAGAIAASNGSGKWARVTTISMANEQPQFYDSVAPTKYVKVDPVGVTATKTATLGFSNTDDATFTFPVTGGTVALTTGTVERIGAAFDGGGSAIALNKIAYFHVPYAITSINQWTVVCDQDSGATGIIITPYMDAYAADTLPTTTMCTTGTPPHTTDGVGAGGSVHQAAWDCNITAIPADRIIAFKVTTAPTAATWCSVTLKVTR